METKTTVAAPLLLCVTAVLLLFSRGLNPELLGYGENIYLSVIILQILTLILPGMFYSRLGGTGYALRLNFRPLGMRSAFFILCSFLALVAGSAALGMAGYKIGLYSSRLTLFDSYIPAAVSYDDALFAYVLVAFAVIPAVAEEFVFRALLLSEYSRWGGELAAFCAVTLAYAMLPMDFAALPGQLFVGGVLAAAAIITRSAFAPVIIRFGYNLTLLAFEPSFKAALRGSGAPVYMMFAAAALFFVFLTLALNEAERLYRYYSVSGTPAPVFAAETSGFTNETNGFVYETGGKTAPKKTSGAKNAKFGAKNAIDDAKTPDSKSDAAAEKKPFARRFGEALFSPTYLAYAVIFLISAIFRLAGHNG